MSADRFAPVDLSNPAEQPPPDPDDIPEPDPVVDLDPPPPPAETSLGATSAPLRRLTQEELNHTLRDLFVGIPLPVVALSDGDGRSYDGDVSRQTPSDLAIEQLRTGAAAVAAAVVLRKADVLPRLPGSTADDQRAVGHELIASLGARAMRRPLEPRELGAYSLFFDSALAADNFDVALELTITALLQAPSFLYRVELGGDAVDDERTAIPSYEMASRLSYLLWSSMPDQELFDAAEAGVLDDPDELEAQARRMLDDPRATDAVVSFHRQWLDFDDVLAASRDAATYPAWDEELKQSIRTESDRMIEESVFGGGDAKLRTLLTTTTTRVNRPLAALYGVAAPATDWDLVQLPGEQRAGLITQAGFLASRSHAVFPSPVLRGVYVLDRFLCQTPPPPEPSIDVTPPVADENAPPTTNRDRYTQHTFNPVCQGCHAGIDGIGMGLEGYDAIGRFRTTDNGFPVDDSGTLEATGAGGSYNGGPALAAMLAESDLVTECVARQWLTYTRGRAEDDVDWPAITAATAQFQAADGDIRELLVSIVKSSSFRFLPGQVTP
ncbi:MAG: DUF1592 domain-containing protein [Deltaproteobacteria bacterium]|nr:DUF1592 domain-containing protein [Deltaproteobacteria bacterium]